MYKDIAIIGMSMRLPQANDIDSLHANLSTKKDCIRKVPKERRELLRLDENSDYLEVGYIDDIEYFDHSFFNIPSMEADVMCIEQRFSLEMAAEAILDAGYSLESFRGKNCCVYYSSTDNEYKLLAGQTSAAAYTGNLKSLTGGKICYYFDLHGPNLTVDSACSSSLVALHEACMKIVTGECEYSLAGGFSVNIYIPSFNDNDFNNLGVISGGGRSYSFDARAQGTGMGEGGGFVLLKSLEAAQRDHDHIYGVIKGSAINSDGFRGSSLTAPSSAGQKEAIVEAWKRGNISGEDITEFEAHGTGTLIGDPIEAEGIQNSLNEYPDNGRKVYLSAVKSSIGHLAAAAGIAAVLKSLTQFEKGVTYPIANFETPNPYIDFDKMRLEPLKEVKHWNENERRVVGINSFGFGGTNAHVVIENYRNDRQRECVSSDAPFILKVSAKNINSLEQLAAKIAKFLKENKNNINDSIYTLNTGRDDYSCRICVSANSAEDLIEKLRNSTPVVFRKRKLAFVITQPSDLTEELLRKQIDEYKALKKLGFEYDFLLADDYGKYVTAMSESSEITDDLAAKAKEFADKYEVKNIGDVLSKIKEKEKIIAVFFCSDENTEKYADESCSIVVRGENGIADIICGYYLNGGSVQWDKLYDSEKYFKVSAPTYVFSKIKHWIYPKHRFSALGIVDSIQEEENAKKSIADKEVFKKELHKLWEDVLESEVGEDDDFFDLGGNSLTGMMLIEEVNNIWGISVEFDDVYDHGTFAEFYQFLLENEKQNTAKTVAKPLAAVQKGAVKTEEKYTLASAQKMIYQTIKEYPLNSGWNLCMCIGMEGKVDVPRLENSIQKMIDSNDCYRTVFFEENNEVYQRVLDEYKFTLNVIEAEGESYEERYQWCKNRIDKLSNTSFEMDNVVPLHIKLFKVSEDYSILYIGLSHVISDGTSLGLMVAQINSYYLGEKPQENNYRYYDFCNWQKSFIETSQGKEQERYWKNYLADLDFELGCNYENTGIEKRDAVGKVIVFPINDELHSTISRFCRAERISPFTYTLLAFHILIARLTHKQDVFSLVVTANRRENAYKSVSGCLVDGILLRSKFNPDLTIGEAIRMLSEDVKYGLENQEYPLYNLLWDLKGKEPRLMEDWGEFFMAFQNYKSSKLSLEDITLRAETINKTGCMTKLQLAVSENDSGMYGIFQYNESCFTEDSVEKIKNDYIKILEDIAQCHDEKIVKYL